MDSTSQTELIECHCKSIELGANCTMGISQCCWCSDKRTIRTIYVDEYGVIEPSKNYYQMPRDLYYCSGCKRPDTISVGLFTEELKKCLPSPDIFHGRLTRDKNQIKILHAERMKKIEETERFRRIREILKYKA
jgi:hypothetical protein